MTNHPTVQPVLTVGGVAMLASYLDALTPPDDVTDEYSQGYRTAVRASIHLVEDVWRAAVIAAYAGNMDLQHDD